MDALNPSSTQLLAIRQAREILSRDPLVLDTETTGLGPSAEIVEIAILDQNGQVVFESLVRPKRPIPPDVVRIHGIEDNDVIFSPTWESLWPSIRKMLEGRTIIAYNADFDMQMMKQSSRQYGILWQETWKTECIMKLFARYWVLGDSQWGSYRYHSLANAGKLCNISLTNSHRAADDSRLALQVLRYIANQESQTGEV
jgi:DNA polymerase III epsilon subunit-like protein